MLYLIIYLIGINLIAFLAALKDKRAAQRNQYRISEKALISFGALGGAAGLLFAMFLFRHKTRKPKFTVGVPILLLVNTVCVYYLVQILK